MMQPTDEQKARARERADLIEIATDLLVNGHYPDHQHCICADCEDRIAAALLAAEERGKRDATGPCGKCGGPMLPAACGRCLWQGFTEGDLRDMAAGTFAAPKEGSKT